MPNSRQSTIFRITVACMLIIATGLGCASKKGGKTTPYDGSAVEPFSDEELAMEKGRWKEGNIPEPGQILPGLKRDIFFEYDSSKVRAEFHPDLQSFAQSLQQNPGLLVEIEGHCDRRGTSEYNMALGEERAKAVANLLTNYGANKSQITWVSYGEEIPVDPADNDAAYEKNRRAHLGLYRKRGS